MTQKHWSDVMAESVAQAYPDEPEPFTLDEVDGILTRHGITMAAIAEHIDAEQAGIEAGTIVQLRTPKRNRPAG